MSNEQNQLLEEFKMFVRNHPSLVKEVRRGVYTWQEIYEDWYLLGESNQLWDDYRDDLATVEEDLAKKTESAKEEKDVVATLFDSLKNVDVQSMQKHVSNLSQALGTISGVISQFQSTPAVEEKQVAKQQNPFSLRKD